MQAASSSDDQQRTTVLVFGGGDAPTPADRDRFPEADMVIAADGGADHALACDLVVDLVVGDLDSVSDAGLAAVAAGGAVIERHERDKDESDLELALRRANDHRPGRLVVTAVSGGRSDHFLANLLLTASASLADVDVEVLSGSDRMYVVRGRRSFGVDIDQLVTLLPLHGPAFGVTTSGLRYPLHAETLDAGSSRGISNVAVESSVTVEVQEGVVLVVIPADSEPTSSRP